MNYKIKSNLPGILGLLDHSPESGKILRELAEKVLRDEEFSTIPIGYRELIASRASYWNDCQFCHKSHRAVAVVYLGEDEVIRIEKEEFQEGEKIAGYFKYAGMVAYFPDETSPEDVNALKDEFGITDREIHDITLIVSMFEMYNRYVTASGVDEPALSDKEYSQIALMITEDGYA